jgi:hypothetical protein
MKESVDKARELAESLSEVLNCAGYVLQEPKPRADVLEGFNEAVARVIEAYAVCDLESSDLGAAIEVIAELRVALANDDRAKLASLCQRLLDSFGIQLGSTPPRS